MSAPARDAGAPGRRVAQGGRPTQGPAGAEFYPDPAAGRFVPPFAGGPRTDLDPAACTCRENLGGLPPAP